MNMHIFPSLNILIQLNPANSDLVIFNSTSDQSFAISYVDVAAI